MTQHPDEGRLQAHLDGEVPPGDQDALRGHLRECPPCRERLQDLEALASHTTRVLMTLDRPAPDVEATLWDFRRRKARRRAGGHRRGLAAAAAVILLVAAGAAAAVPGSPLRGWIEARFGAEDPPTETELRELQVERVEVDGEAALGVTVDLLDGAVRVGFRGVPEGMSLELEPTDDARTGVFAPAESRFRTASGRVDVEVVGSGEVLRVRVPERARLAEIWVEDVMVARVEGGIVALPGSASERALDTRIRILVPAPPVLPDTDP